MNTTTIGKANIMTGGTSNLNGNIANQN